MTFKHIIFTVQGCLVEIDGIRCELDSKLAFMRAGGSYLRAIDPDDQPAADALMDVRIGGGDSIESGAWEAWACTDPRVVALDIQCAEWRGDTDNAPWADTPHAEPQLDDAMQFIMTWLATQPAP